MSGIAGILSLDGKTIQTRDMEAMADALSHRGPDGIEFYRNGAVGLISLSLKTHSASHEPFYFGENAVVLDGRIDDHDTLCKLLRKKEISAPITVSSAHLLSLCHTHLNDIFPQCLLGDFAFAVWDKQQEKLTLARDCFGIKPLYYFCDRVRFVFASEIKALFALSDMERKPNQNILEKFKHGRFHTFHETFFENIFRLPPAAVMTVSIYDGIQNRKYWQVNPRRTIRMKNRNAYLSRFRKLFLEAVRVRLPENGTCAVSLSGGLDSSSILGAASELKPYCRLLAVSHLCREFPDERQHIENVVTETNADFAVCFLEDVSLLEGIEEAMHHQESPSYDPEDSFLLQRFKTAGDHGARVMLTGEWGDQVLGGNGYLADNLTQWKFVSLYNDLKILPKYHGGFPYENIRYILKFLLINSPMKQLTWRKNFGPVFPTCAQREMYEELFHPLHVLLLETLNKMAAQAGIEIRFPFLDRRLVQFLIAIPAEERIREGLGKRLLRDGLKGILCEDIAKRTDKGDYTEVADACLKKAGFKTGNLRNQWRNDIIKLWEELWIKRNKRQSPKVKNPEKNESLTKNPS